jgi:16S rRNA (cytidine1402-2'-O)-methyltransferase
MTGTVHLIPTLLHDTGIQSIPAYILPAVRQCKVIFAENERTARRFLKQLDRSIEIDAFEWHTIHEAEDEVLQPFLRALKAGKPVAILSEAGCPGVADPGQKLILAAQQAGAVVRPYTGPNAILLALMASGMNGQHFEFVGYLPIDTAGREKKIKELENASAINQSTKICIETPYRNKQLLDAFLKVCTPQTLLCIAMNITGEDEFIQTKTVSEWKKSLPDVHKKPVVFLLLKNR